MRFLVLSWSRKAIPPERLLELIAAAREWAAVHRATGKLLDDFSLAGRMGSGRILDVESHEELTEIMASYPYGPTSDVEVYPLSDLDAALDFYEQTMKQQLDATDR